MNWSLLVTALVGAGTIVFMFLQYKLTHGDSADKKFQARLDSYIGLRSRPILDRVISLESKTSREARDQEHEIIRGMLNEALSPVGARLATLETKIDVYWRSIAIDQAKILHQPDPRRHHIDVLLEAFMDGSITDGQRLELRKYLYIIRNWEAGQDVGFPVYPGESVAAAILLRTMDHVIEQARITNSGKHR